MLSGQNMIGFGWSQYQNNFKKTYEDMIGLGDKNESLERGRTGVFFLTYQSCLCYKT